MSYARKHNNRNNHYAAMDNKLYCSACYKAGREMAIVTSHNPREMVRGKWMVVCPTIKTMICQYCRTVGHSKAYCTAYKRAYEEMATPAPLEKKRSVAPPPAPKKPANMFTALDTDEEEPEVKFPKIVVRKINWADYDSDSDEE
jgi:Nanos RNA binding domain